LKEAPRMRESKFGTDTVVWLFNWTSALFASMDTIVPLIQPVDPPEEDWLWMYTSAPASKAVGLPASFARDQTRIGFGSSNLVSTKPGEGWDLSYES